MSLYAKREPTDCGRRLLAGSKHGTDHAPDAGGRSWRIGDRPGASVTSGRQELARRGAWPDGQRWRQGADFRCGCLSCRHSSDGRACRGESVRARLSRQLDVRGRVCRGRPRHERIRLSANVRRPSSASAWGLFADVRQVVGRGRKTGASTRFPWVYAVCSTAPRTSRRALTGLLAYDHMIRVIE